MKNCFVTKRKTSLRLFACILLVAAAASLTVFSGCAGSGTEQTSAAVPGSTDSHGSESQATPSAADSFVFKKGDVTIAMHAPAGPVIEALGAYTNYYEEPSCAFEGMDKTYSYPGFDVTTYTKGGSDYVSGVIFWDDSVATAEGVYIGQTLEDIRKAYGADVSGETSVSLTRGASKLLFLLKDGAVSSIQYLAVEN